MFPGEAGGDGEVEGGEKRARGLETAAMRAWSVGVRRAEYRASRRDVGT
jgi:hypothetical protein